MNVVDSSGWLEYLAGGPNAGVFAEPLRHPAQVVVPAIVVYEVVRIMWRERGEDPALEAATLLREGQVVPLDHEIAVAAAALGLEMSLAMADSIILATAQARRATLWTQDADFKGMDGVRYVPRKKP